MKELVEQEGFRKRLQMATRYFTTEMTERMSSTWQRRSSSVPWASGRDDGKCGQSTATTGTMSLLNSRAGCYWISLQFSPLLGVVGLFVTSTSVAELPDVNKNDQKGLVGNREVGFID